MSTPPVSIPTAPPDRARPAGVVTPEAVLLEFETAGVGSRLVARFIDVVIQIVALVLFSLAAAFIGGLVGAGGGTAAVIAGLVLVFLTFIGYPVAMETLWGGRTLGKAVMGLRVVTVEGGPIRFRHAAARGIVGLVELWVLSGAIAVISVILTQRDQRLGDLAAGTIVLRERVTAANQATPVSFAPPYGFDAYVAALDVSALTVDQYGTIRSFLMRVLDLSAPARQSLAIKLANAVALELRHTPPPGLPPELFLVCVASAYQRRRGGWGTPNPGWGPPAAAAAVPATGWGVAPSR